MFSNSVPFVYAKKGAAIVEHFGFSCNVVCYTRGGGDLIRSDFPGLGNFGLEFGGGGVALLSEFFTIAGAQMNDSPIGALRAMLLLLGNKGAFPVDTVDSVLVRILSDIPQVGKGLQEWFGHAMLGSYK